MGDHHRRKAAVILLLILFLQTAAVFAAQVCPIDKIPTEVKISHSRAPRNLAIGQTDNKIIIALSLIAHDTSGKDVPIAGSNLSVTVTIPVVDSSGRTVQTNVIDNQQMTTDSFGQIAFEVKTGSLDPRKMQYTISAIYVPEPRSVYIGSGKTESYTPAAISPASLSACFPFFLVAGLLMAALYASGKDPFGFFDFSRAAIRPPPIRARQPKLISVSTDVMGLAKIALKAKNIPAAVKAAKEVSQAGKVEAQKAYQQAVRAGLGTMEARRQRLKVKQATAQRAKAAAANTLTPAAAPAVPKAAPTTRLGTIAAKMAGAAAVVAVVGRKAIGMPSEKDLRETAAKKLSREFTQEDINRLAKTKGRVPTRQEIDEMKAKLKTRPEDITTAQLRALQKGYRPIFNSQGKGRIALLSVAFAPGLFEGGWPKVDDSTAGSKLVARRGVVEQFKAFHAGVQAMKTAPRLDVAKNMAAAANIVARNRAAWSLNKPTKEVTAEEMSKELKNVKRADIMDMLKKASPADITREAKKISANDPNVQKHLKTVTNADIVRQARSNLLSFGGLDPKSLSWRGPGSQWIDVPGYGTIELGGRLGTPTTTSLEQLVTRKSGSELEQSRVQKDPKEVLKRLREELRAFNSEWVAKDLGKVLFERTESEGIKTLDKTVRSGDVKLNAKETIVSKDAFTQFTRANRANNLDLSPNLKSDPIAAREVVKQNDLKSVNPDLVISNPRYRDNTLLADIAVSLLDKKKADVVAKSSEQVMKIASEAGVERFDSTRLTDPKYRKSIQEEMELSVGATGAKKAIDSINEIAKDMNKSLDQIKSPGKKEIEDTQKIIGLLDALHASAEKRSTLVGIKAGVSVDFDRYISDPDARKEIQASITKSAKGDAPAVIKELDSIGNAFKSQVQTQIEAPYGAKIDSEKYVANTTYRQQVFSELTRELGTAKAEAVMSELNKTVGFFDQTKLSESADALAKKFDISKDLALAKIVKDYISKDPALAKTVKDYVSPMPSISTEDTSKLVSVMASGRGTSSYDPVLQKEIIELDNLKAKYPESPPKEAAARMTELTQLIDGAYDNRKVEIKKASEADVRMVETYFGTINNYSVQGTSADLESERRHAEKKMTNLETRTLDMPPGAERNELNAKIQELNKTIEGIKTQQDTLNEYIKDTHSYASELHFGELAPSVAREASEGLASAVFDRWTNAGAALKGTTIGDAVDALQPYLQLAEAPNMYNFSPEQVKDFAQKVRTLDNMLHEPDIMKKYGVEIDANKVSVSNMLEDMANTTAAARAKLNVDTILNGPAATTVETGEGATGPVRALEYEKLPPTEGAQPSAQEQKPTTGAAEPSTGSRTEERPLSGGEVKLGGLATPATTEAPKAVITKADLFPEMESLNRLSKNLLEGAVIDLAANADEFEKTLNQLAPKASIEAAPKVTVAEAEVVSLPKLNEFKLEIVTKEEKPGGKEAKA